MADEKIIFSMVGVSKTFTNQKKVLNNIYLSFFYGAKIGIIGLNGSGKSTLMKIIAGLDKNFQGEVVFSPGYTVGYLEQEPRLDDSKTVREVVEEGCAAPPKWRSSMPTTCPRRWHRNTVPIIRARPAAWDTR